MRYKKTIGRAPEDLEIKIEEVCVYICILGLQLGSYNQNKYTVP